MTTILNKEHCIMCGKPTKNEIQEGENIFYLCDEKKCRDELARSYSMYDPGWEEYS